MIIKRKYFSVGLVLNAGLNAAGIAGMAGEHKAGKQSKEEHEIAMKQGMAENKQLVRQLDNIAKS